MPCTALHSRKRMCARHTIVETSAQPPAQTQAKQTPDMPPLRCAHASGPPEANALRATYRVATPCTGPPSGRVGWAFTHTRRGGPASAVASSPLPRRHIMHLPSGSRAPRAWFSSARNLPTLPPQAELTGSAGSPASLPDRRTARSSRAASLGSERIVTCTWREGSLWKITSTP